MSFSVSCRDAEAVAVLEEAQNKPHGVPSELGPDLGSELGSELGSASGVSVSLSAFILKSPFLSAAHRLTPD